MSGCHWWCGSRKSAENKGVKRRMRKTMQQQEAVGTSTNILVSGLAVVVCKTEHGDSRGRLDAQAIVMIARVATRPEPSRCHARKHVSDKLSKACCVGGLLHHGLHVPGVRLVHHASLNREASLDLKVCAQPRHRVVVHAHTSVLGPLGSSNNVRL